jgi:hypothetical protein
MQNHNFKIVGGDTDSIMFCKPDMSLFTEDEQESLLSEINSLLPKEIKFANDGIFSRVLYLKSKNYVMVDSKGKRKMKGSALKSATLEPKMKQLLNEMIDALVEDKPYLLLSIYHKYIREASKITDIKPWAKKMTLSATTYASTRKNETNIIDAIKDTEYVEGDKCYLYFKSDGSLCLADKFDGDYHHAKYYEKVYNTALRFSTIIDDSIFLNFKLKRNSEELEKVLNEPI